MPYPPNILHLGDKNSGILLFCTICGSNYWYNYIKLWRLLLVKKKKEKNISVSQRKNFLRWILNLTLPIAHNLKINIKPSNQTYHHISNFTPIRLIKNNALILFSPLFFLAKRNDIYIRSQLRLLFRVFWSAVGDNPVTRFPACIETSGRNLIMNASQISRFEVHGESDI